MSLGLDQDKLPHEDSPRRIIFSWLYDYLEKLSVFRKYVRTHSALAGGHALFDETDERLDQLGLFKPLRFNLYQTAISAAPAILVVQLLGFLFVPDGNALDPSADHLDPGWGLLEQRTDRLFEKLAPSIVAFAAPLGLLIFAAIAARASLQPEHRSSATLSRHRRAYLYYDAYHGLLPQTFLSLAISLRNFLYINLEVVFKFQVFAFVIEWIGTVLFFLWLVQLAIDCSIIPSALYKLAGYSEMVCGIAAGAEWRGAPPKATYILWTLLIAPTLVYIVYFVLLVLGFVVARGGALIQGITSST